MKPPIILAIGAIPLIGRLVNIGRQAIIISHYLMILHTVSISKKETVLAVARKAAKAAGFVVSGNSIRARVWGGLNQSMLAVSS